MNPFDETRRAVDLAEQQIRATDRIATDMARLLVGRLRKVDAPWILKDLKRELANYNMQTGEWKP
jgi:hypothetical protein